VRAAAPPSPGAHIMMQAISNHLRLGMCVYVAVRAMAFLDTPEVDLTDYLPYYGESIGKQRPLNWLVAMVVGVVYHTTFNQPDLVGRRASSLEGLDFVQGQPVSLGGGGLVCVVIWGTRTLARSMQRLNEMTSHWGKGAPVTFVAVSREAKSKVLAHVKANKADVGKIAVAVDTTADLSVYNRYPVAAVPTLFLVGNDEMIKWQGHPMDPKLVGAVDKELLALARTRQHHSARTPPASRAGGSKKKRRNVVRA
jgi:hypothetical protein